MFLQLAIVMATVRNVSLMMKLAIRIRLKMYPVITKEVECVRTAFTIQREPIARIVFLNSIGPIINSILILMAASHVTVTTLLRLVIVRMALEGASAEWSLCHHIVTSAISDTTTTHAANPATASERAQLVESAK